MFSVFELTKSKKADAEAKVLENRMLEMKWKADYETHLREEVDFKDNWVKAYALIWDSYYSRKMQMVVRELPDFDTTIINEPLEILSPIESLMHVPMKSKYPPLTLIDILCIFFCD